MLQLSRFIPLGGFVILVLLLFRGLSIDPTSLPSARVGQSFPNFSQIELISGTLIGPESLVPKPALLNVWATWCYSCRVEHPFLLALSRQGIPIFGLNYKDDPEKARSWLNELGDPYRLNIIDDKGQLGLDLGVYGAPETYVLGSNGTILHRHVGTMTLGIYESEIAHFFQAQQ